MLNPKEMRIVAPKYEAENMKFRSFLKNRANADELDNHFKRLHEELFLGYDCCKCANCCKEYRICFYDNDILNAAGLLNIDQEKLIETYLVEGDENYVIEPPCSFLEEDGKCRIQQAKPIECAEFPYTNKPERLFSLLGVMEFAQSCPIVFEVVQRLKDIYNFRSRVRL